MMGERGKGRGLTRGGLFKAGAVAALAVGSGGAGAALAGTTGAALASTMAPSRLRKPNGGPAYLWLASYAPLVGSEFRVAQGAGNGRRIKLVEAKELPGIGESFSLIFEGPKSAAVPMGSALYRLVHPSFGEFELYLNPVDRPTAHVNLQAVINRIAT
jgi:hypothetical protein